MPLHCLPSFPHSPACTISDTRWASKSSTSEAHRFCMAVHTLQLVHIIRTASHHPCPRSAHLLSVRRHGTEVNRRTGLDIRPPAHLRSLRVLPVALGLGLAMLLVVVVVVLAPAPTLGLLDHPHRAWRSVSFGRYGAPSKIVAPLAICLPPSVSSTDGVSAGPATAVDAEAE